MIKDIKNIRAFYRTLGSNTRLVIRISFITVICTILTAIYTYTATDNSNYYTLLTISDDLLELARSFTFVGFISTLAVGYIEKTKMNNECE
ncbi:MAG: hypothetical protein IJ025_07330 [Clostridia bacterium]|nr:hypothetical protein [Clostridia bacterium]